MSKRFCDTEIWQKDWFLNLTDTQKLLTKFVFDNCDCAGIYEISWKMLKVFFNSEITKKDFEAIKQVKFIDDNTVFIEDFILFQCGISSLKDLNPNNNAHKGIIKRLEKLGANKGLTRGSCGAHSAAQEKEEEKEKDNNNLSFLASSFLSENQEPFKKKIDPFTNPLIDKCFEIYKQECPDLLKLGFEPRTAKVREEVAKFLDDIDCDIGYFTELCRKANSLKEIVNKAIDFTMLIRNHIGINNGKYKNNNTFDITEYLKGSS